MQEPNRERQSGEERHIDPGKTSVFHRYHLGWVIAAMLLTIGFLLYINGGLAVFSTFEGCAAMILLPLIVGALVFRSMLVADYNKRKQSAQQDEE